MFIGVGNDRHLELSLLRIADRQADTVDRNRPFLHRTIIPRRFVFERKIPAAFGIIDGRTNGRLIHMALDDMAVEQRIGPHRTLHIDDIADLQLAQIAAQQRLFHCRYGVGILRNIHHGQAYAVVGNALIDLQLPAKIRTKSEGLILLFDTDIGERHRSFHDS